MKKKKKTKSTKCLKILSYIWNTILLGADKVIEQALR